MDVSRAQQIIQSEQTIKVEYNGESVWIDRVDEENAMAQVHREQDPSVIKFVEIGQLKEI